MNRRTSFASLLAFLGIGAAAAQTRIAQNQIRPGAPGKLLGADIQPVTVGEGLQLENGTLSATPAAPSTPSTRLARVIPTSIDAAAGVYHFAGGVVPSTLFVIRNGIWDSPNAGNVADDATGSITLANPQATDDVQFVA